MTQYKSFTDVEVTAKGTVTAVFATMWPHVDLDGDSALPGAFAGNRDVLLSTWNHGSWERGTPPAGKATIREAGGEAIVEGTFFMTTDVGRQTHAVLKEMSEAGISPEWSYGYNADEVEPGEVNGRRVQLLKRVTIHECSPVIRGAAGPGMTRTLAAKAATTDSPQDIAIREHLRYVQWQIDQAVREELADIYDQWELRDEMTRIARNYGGWPHG